MIDPTRRVVVLVNGQRLDVWTHVSIERSLHEIAGSFEMAYRDQGRLAETLTTLLAPPPFFAPLAPGQKVQILIDGEPVLVGWIGKIKLKSTADEMSAEISGRDICGDLVECAALPNGPSDFHNIKLDAYTGTICAPFGVGVQVQTDIGAMFPVLSTSPHEKALPAIEQATRQRSVLLTSDGVANLVLTTAGSTRGPAPLVWGQNIIEAEFEDNWDHRYSDVYVKGQSARAAGNHVGVPAPMTPSTAPGAGAVPGTAATTRERAGIVMTGHAKDPQITRWRPDVRMVKTQSGASSVQQQAEWHVRVDRGLAIHNQYTVLDWRAGPAMQLWRPNQLVAVYDPYAQVDDDMLIDGVRYRYDEHGARTVLKLVGKTAYERLNEPARAQPRHRGK